MANEPNFRMRKTSGGSPADKKIRSLAESIHKKLYARYGELLKQFSQAELMRVICLHFGDDPIRAMMEKSDRIGNALRYMYGEPISRRIY